MAAPLDGWTGEGIGHGVTTSPLYARTQPDFNAPAVTLWAKGEPLILWAFYAGWYLVASLTHVQAIGWSSAAYIERTA